MHFDGKMKSNRRKIERGLGILPYGNSTTQTIGKCGGFRLCHDTGSACYVCFRHSKRVCRCSDCLGNLIGTHILG